MEVGTDRSGWARAARAAAINAHSDVCSFNGWAASEPTQALREVQERPGATWADVHTALGPYNLTLKPRGAGLVIRRP